MDKSASNEVSITKITIKKENLNDEIKDFAETAMNELLGWYGYDRQDETRKNRICRSHSGSNSSSPGSPKFTDGCGWCGKTVEESTGLTSTMATFCSELCFSQSRRANFKKNKTCDWCHHVRNTISYVDFQDGASQLQFCSDKCLNQYKMHIFCRETRAHLELHPHLYAEEATSGTLITPDLWLKNCKSPQPRSPSPSISPKVQEIQPQTSPLPLISVAHPSKLMCSSIPESKRSRIKMQKKTKKRYSSTITNNSLKLSPNDTPQDLRIRHSPNDFETARLTVKDPIQINQETEKSNPETKSQSTHIPDSVEETPQLHSTTSPTNETLPKRSLETFLPPPTILVPYPIILPIPIPIPIPLPILKREDKVNKTDSSSQTEVVTETSVEEKETLSQSSQKDQNQENTNDKQTNCGRPLRKRRKVLEVRRKVILKKNKV